MTTFDVMAIRIGDVLKLRKPHPCGGDEWSVVRLGADIGLRCELCGRRVLIERPILERRVKALVRRGEGPTAEEVLRRLESAS